MSHSRKRKSNGLHAGTPISSGTTTTIGMQLYFYFLNDLIFSGFVTTILVNLLPRNDIAKYNRLETTDLFDKWKHIHRDVFRAPSNSGLLSVYVGTGVQILAMTLVTMFSLLSGLLSPFNTGEFMVPLWALMGLFAGYSSARLSKMFKVTKWKTNALKTAFMFLVFLFSVLFVMNALLREKKSSAAIPIGTMFEVAFSWLVKMFAPCVFLGSCFGFNRHAHKDPVKTNDVPRKIPLPSPTWKWQILQVLLPTMMLMIPFSCPWIQLEFVMKSIWVDKFYNLFGFTWFLLLGFVWIMVICAETTVMLCYLQLCLEDYNWYLVGGVSPGLYLFLYSVIFFFTNLEIRGVVPVIIYFGCMLVASFALFMMAGTIAFYACLWYVRKLYSTVEVN